MGLTMVVVLIDILELNLKLLLEWIFFIMDILGIVEYLTFFGILITILYYLNRQNTPI